MDDLEFLKTHAPSTERPGDAATARAREALRARIDAEEAPPAAEQRERRRHPWRWVGLAAACVAAAAVAASFLLAGSPARPDTAAASALHKAAEAARRQPSPAPLAAGEYVYVKSEGVQLMDVSQQAGVRFSVHVPFVREVWMGEHSLLRETGGKAEFITPKDRETWVAAGKPHFYDGPQTSREPLNKYVPLDLSTNPSVLFARLKLEALGHGTGLYNEMFVLVGDDLRETATSPAQRAALYEVAARIPGVELVGNVNDSAGRPGIAVAMTDATSHTHHVLTFDPTTSQLLAEEETVVEGNEFGWPSGTLIGSTTYLVHAVVGSDSEVPAAQK